MTPRLPRAVAAALSLVAGLSISSSAFAWGDTAAQVWVQRTDAMVAAALQPIYPADSPDAGKNVIYVYPQSALSILGKSEKPEGYDARNAAAAAYIENMKQTCSGLTGELIKNGGKNMPVWAQTAQQRFCSSVTALKSAAFDDPSDKNRCKDAASVVSNASKAKVGEDPEAIVEAAKRLAGAAEMLQSIDLIMIKKGMGGLMEGSRTFSCK